MSVVVPRSLGAGCAALLISGGLASAQPQDGTWTGTTGQGGAYNFAVKNGGTKINPLTIDFALGSCTGTFSFTSDISIVGITSYSFSASGGSCPLTTTSGNFSSSTAASGTVRFRAVFNPPACSCSGDVTTTWSATKTPAQANLSVSKSDGQVSAVPGNPIVYTITVTNAGPDSVSSVILTDTLPATLVNPVFTPSTGSYNPATGAWTGLNLGAGQSVGLTLSATVSPSATGTLANTATVAPPAGAVDPVPGNNSATDTDSLNPQASLALTKTGPGAATPPSNLPYTIVVTNNGPSNATGVAVTDATPPGLTFVSNTGACASTFPCNLGTIPAGQSRTIDATFNVPAGYAGANPISNTAGVSASTPDPTPGNNSATATTLVVPPGPPSSFFTVAPCRLVDTRNPNGPFGGPALGAGVDRTFTATDNCGVPIGARAVAVNVTATQASTGGNLRLYPTGTPLPLVSTLNYSAGQTRGNNAVVPLNGAGMFTIRCAQATGTAHVIVDVNGYFLE